MSTDHPPRAGGWWPLLLVLVGVVLGLVIAVTGDEAWRAGCLVIGASLVVGGALRAVLPPRVAGLLQVRARWFDVAVLTLAGAAIIALAIVVPEGRR